MAPEENRRRSACKQVSPTDIVPRRDLNPGPLTLCSGDRRQDALCRVHLPLRVYRCIGRQGGLLYLTVINGLEPAVNYLPINQFVFKRFNTHPAINPLPSPLQLLHPDRDRAFSLQQRACVWVCRTTRHFCFFKLLCACLPLTPSLSSLSCSLARSLCSFHLHVPEKASVKHNNNK